MDGPLSFGALRALLQATFAQLPDVRSGRNTQYAVADAAMAAFSAFFLQAPSFLAHQRQMQRQQGRNNARSLFGVQKIPSDPQIRTLLDPVAPADLAAPFWTILDDLAHAGYLDDFRWAGMLLCSLDGTHYFGSTAIHCGQCNTQEREDATYYFHAVLLPVLVRPEKREVLALEPEFQSPQDGTSKQDCEQQAAKRWIRRHGSRLASLGVTILADDLHSTQPFCALLLEQHLHFILTCKPDSHVALYEDLAGLARLGAINERVERVWTGKHHQQWTYRWVQAVPLRAAEPALPVNWCEVTIVREDSGETLYHNAWVTDHPLEAHTVRALVAAGRGRWKVENEDINVLKNQGYHLEHNYGHGQRYLAMVLVMLTVLAFLCHTVLHLADNRYRSLRAALGARRTFFDDLRALTRYLVFASWEHLLDFMMEQLELGPG